MPACKREELAPRGRLLTFVTLFLGAVSAASALSSMEAKKDRIDLAHAPAGVCGLADKQCVPCRGGVPPMTPEEVARALTELSGWTLNDKGHLFKSYAFPNFKKGFDFVARVTEMAESQGSED